MIHIPNRETPAIIARLQIASALKMPVGYSMYERAIKEPPEYFPEEVARRNKWESVPPRVKDAYFEGMNQISAAFNAGNPSKGFVYWAEHPEELAEWEQQRELKMPERRRQERNLHEQYLAKYGIEYSDSF